MLLTNGNKFNKLDKGFSLLANKQSSTQLLVLSRSFLSGSAFKNIGSTLFKVCSLAVLKSYKLFQERLDNLFLTQKNLYPFMFILVLFSFVTFFFVIVTLIILLLGTIF